MINEEAKGLLQNGKALDWDSYGSLDDVSLRKNHQRFLNTRFVIKL